MQSLMFLESFVLKLSKKNLWGGLLDPPHGKGRVKISRGVGGGGLATTHIPVGQICEPNWLDHWRVKTFFKHFSLCGF